MPGRWWKIALNEKKWKKNGRGRQSGRAISHPGPGDRPADGLFAAETPVFDGGSFYRCLWRSACIPAAAGAARVAGPSASPHDPLSTAPACSAAGDAKLRRVVSQSRARGVVVLLPLRVGEARGRKGEGEREGGGERHKRGGDGFGDGSGDRSGQRQRPELICTEHKTSSVCAFCFLCFPSASTLLRTASQPKSLRHAHS